MTFSGKEKYCGTVGAAKIPLLQAIAVTEPNSEKTFGDEAAKLKASKNKQTAMI